MSPLVWDLAHIANQEELWLLREVGGRESMHPEIDPLYDAFEHPRAERPTCRCCRRPRPAPTATRSAAGSSTCSSGPGSGTPRPGPAAAQRRVRVRHDRPARGAARRDDADHPPDPAGRPVLTARAARPGAGRRAAAAARGAGARAARSPWAPRPSPGRWTTSGPRTPSTCRPFYLDTTPVTCGAYAEFIADGGYDDPRWWTAGRLGSPAAGRAVRAAVLEPGRGQWIRDGVRRHRAGPAGRARAARVLVRGRRVRPLGGPPAADRGRVGEGGPVRSRPPGCPAATRGATPIRTSPGPTSASSSCARPRPAPTRKARRRAGPGSSSGTSGSGRARDFLPYPGFAAWPYREYSEVFFGPEYKVLRGGSFAVSPVACRGTFRNWDYPIRRQIFAGFRTARRCRRGGDRLMCRHLAYLGPPATLRSVIIEPPHGLYRQAWAPRLQRHGTVNADGFGVGWYARRRPGARQVPAGRSRSGRTSPSPTWPG